MQLLKILKSAVLYLARRRSPQWPAKERAHLREEPRCQWCGGVGSLQVHHIVPYHIDPARELDDTNLITLCMDPAAECHLRQGHRDNWLDWDPDIRKKCEERRHP